MNRSLAAIASLAVSATAASAQLIAAGPFQSSNTDFYTLSEVNGAATPFAPFNVFDIASGMTWDGERLLAATSDALYAIDPDTGLSTFLFFLGAAAPGGEGCIAARPGTDELYAISDNILWRIDLNTGIPTLIRDGLPNNNWNGLTFGPDGRLFTIVFSFSFSRLYEVQLPSGFITEIGPMNFPPNSGNNPGVTGLAFNPDLQAMYAAYLGDLYRVNFFNGASVRLGASGLGSISGLAYVGSPPPAGCPADLAPPQGVLDLADISFFIGDFEDPFGSFPFQDNRAEALAPPFEIADLADITVFVTSFVAGCP